MYIDDGTGLEHQLPNLRVGSLLCEVADIEGAVLVLFPAMRVLAKLRLLMIDRVNCCDLTNVLRRTCLRPHFCMKESDYTMLCLAVQWSCSGGRAVM
jgi:hypothetical protein